MLIAKEDVFQKLTEKVNEKKEQLRQEFVESFFISESTTFYVVNQEENKVVAGPYNKKRAQMVMESFDVEGLSILPEDKIASFVAKQ